MDKVLFLFESTVNPPKSESSIFDCLKIMCLRGEDIALLDYNIRGHMRELMMLLIILLGYICVS